MVKNMNKKIKYGLLACVVIVIAIVAISSILGSAEKNDPTHLVVTMMGHAGEPETGFNPLTGWGCGHLNFNPLIQSTLLTSDENGDFVGDLATNYTTSSDGLIWTVNIRDDVKFSNNASLKASDVAFTFNEARQSNSQLDMSNLRCGTSLSRIPWSRRSA